MARTNLGSTLTGPFGLNLGSGTIINIQFFDMETQEFDYETVEAEQSIKDKF